MLVELSKHHWAIFFLINVTEGSLLLTSWTWCERRCKDSFKTLPTRFEYQYKPTTKNQATNYDVYSFNPVEV